ncbi:hypothetical protein NPIL_423891 [Nephila pilipes]|uniref:Uncharacterized protein n=1 Tax=Nephila pilipes TaxID=299642 RepID=A0A8X6P8H0_NEPPI|nr:hypothetical protein NPIL_423891 [Nephila pilipes]
MDSKMNAEGNSKAFLSMQIPDGTITIHQERSIICNCVQRLQGDNPPGSRSAQPTLPLPSNDQSGNPPGHIKSFRKIRHIYSQLEH